MDVGPEIGQCGFLLGISFSSVFYYKQPPLLQSLPPELLYIHSYLQRQNVIYVLFFLGWGIGQKTSVA